MHILHFRFIKRTHSLLTRFSKQQTSLAIVPFWFGGMRAWLRVFSKNKRMPNKLKAYCCNMCDAFRDDVSTTRLSA